MGVRLFRVVQVYVHTGLLGETKYLPAVKEVTIIKETPKTYLVQSDLASSWHSVIQKGNSREYSFTATEAWDKYIHQASALLTSIRTQQNQTSDMIAYAREERKKS